MASDWAETCATVMTSTTAEPADKFACREALRKGESSEAWPVAFMLVGLALAVALGFKWTT